MLSIVYLIFVLSILVLVHEFGHFIVARKLGVRVERFSLGFGPKICSIRRGETEYLISVIPLGGYVKMAGDEPWEKLKNQRWEFLSRSVFDRFKIIAAGPVTNYLLAFIIFSVVFMFGSLAMTTEVGDIRADYPAKSSGLIVGDKILSVNGKAVRFWDDMTEEIRRHVDDDVRLEVERAGRRFELNIKPKVLAAKDIFGNESKAAYIGIGPSQSLTKEKYPFPQCFIMGGKKLVRLTYVTCKALWSIVTRKVSVKDSMTGPLGIAEIAKRVAKLGIIPFLDFLAVLSASLAIFNLLPLPVLDGGHILFLCIEKVRGKPLSLKAQEVIANIGVAFLIMLTVVIFYNDIIKFGILDRATKIFRR